MSVMGQLVKGRRTEVTDKLRAEINKVVREELTSSMKRTPGINSAIPWSMYELTTLLISARSPGRDAARPRHGERATARRTGHYERHGTARQGSQDGTRAISTPS
jgi:hypothetical protein